MRPSATAGRWQRQSCRSAGGRRAVASNAPSPLPSRGHVAIACANLPTFAQTRTIGPTRWLTEIRRCDPSPLSRPALRSLRRVPPRVRRSARKQCWKPMPLRPCGAAAPGLPRNPDSVTSHGRQRPPIASWPPSQRSGRRGSSPTIIAPTCFTPPSRAARARNWMRWPPALSPGSPRICATGARPKASGAAG